MTTGKNGSQEIETRIGTLEFTHDFAKGFPLSEARDAEFQLAPTGFEPVFESRPRFRQRDLDLPPV